jgi:hypothetical protein
MAPGLVSAPVPGGLGGLMRKGWWVATCDGGLEDAAVEVVAISLKEDLMSNEEKTPVTIALDTEVLDQARYLAKKSGMSLEAWIEDLVEKRTAPKERGFQRPKSGGKFGSRGIEHGSRHGIQRRGHTP